ncbi:MAG: hypothetical protein K2J80_03015 [Oscillospiraceae bacterium]|nr:hypothetical protein [Oscillospiraceae bacterium]
MKKTILAAAVFVAIVLSLTACGKSENPLGNVSHFESTASSKPASSATEQTSNKENSNTASTPASKPDTSSKTNTPKLPDGTEITFKPTQEFADECGNVARELVADNYKIIRLFISEGLPHLDEPYGNRPEDGLYIVKSDRYSSLGEIETFVKSIYTEKEAQRILTQMPSDPAVLLDGGDSADAVLVAVYGIREIYVDVPSDEPDGADEPEYGGTVVPSDENNEAGDGLEPSAPHYTKQSVLGINELFKPYTAYRKPWGSISIRVLPTSEEECHVTVYLGADKDVNLSSVEETNILETKMIKENGEWRLENLIY